MVKDHVDPPLKRQSKKKKMFSDADKVRLETLKVALDQAEEMIDGLEFEDELVNQLFMHIEDAIGTLNEFNEKYGGRY